MLIILIHLFLSYILYFQLLFSISWEVPKVMVSDLISTVMLNFAQRSTKIIMVPKVNKFVQGWNQRSSNTIMVKLMIISLNSIWMVLGKYSHQTCLCKLFLNNFHILKLQLSQVGSFDLLGRKDEEI